MIGGRTGESLVNISGLGLADAGMVIWAGMALLAVLGFLLGFAINHGSICTVIATTELVSEKRPARFIALVECAVWAALVYAILEMSPTMQQGWSPLGYLVPAATLFGIGAYVNGAPVCSDLSGISGMATSTSVSRFSASLRCSTSNLCLVCFRISRQ